MACGDGASWCVECLECVDKTEDEGRLMNDRDPSLAEKKE